MTRDACATWLRLVKGTGQAGAGRVLIVGRLGREQLAERRGLHRTYLSGIERATRNVSLCTLELLAAGLECDAAELLTRPTAGFAA